MESPINSWILKEKEKKDNEIKILSDAIANWFDISKKLSLKLIKDDSIFSLSDLQREINEFHKDQQKEWHSSIKDENDFNDKFDKKILEKLLLVLKWAKDEINKLSKNEISQLKDIIDNNDLIELDENIIKSLFPAKLITKAKNPQNLSEQILSATLGVTNSTLVIISILYNIWKWIITSIPDLILILRWKWEIENIKKV